MRRIWLPMLLVLAGGALAQLRIVSLHPYTTDLLFDLGFGTQLVGRSFHSAPYVDIAHGVSAAELPNVGFEFNLNAEGILALAPTLIVGLETNGPQQVIAQLQASGVPLLLLDARPTLEGARARVTALAGALAVPERAAELLAIMEEAEAKLEAVQAGVAPLAGIIMVSWSGAPQACGGDSDFHPMFELAGGNNLLAALSGCPQLNPEALVGLDPQVIFFPEVGQYHGVGGLAGLRQRAAFNRLPAVQRGRVVIMESPAFRSFSVRAPEHALRIHQALYRHEGVVMVTESGEIIPYPEAVEGR